MNHEQVNEEVEAVTVVSEDYDPKAKFLALEQERDDLVYLPIGGKVDGQVVRIVQIKEPDGHTEALQTDQAYRKYMATIVNATLADCIVSLQGVKLPNKRDELLEMKMDFVRTLPEPDRQYLMLRLYRLQYGEKYKASVTCTECQYAQTVETNLVSDLDIVFVDDEEPGFNESDRLIIRDVELPYPITVKGQTYDVINVRIPDGNTALSLEKSNNMGEATTKLLFNMLLVNQDKFIPSENEVRGWTRKVRTGIVEALKGRRKGFINTIHCKCESCEKDFTGMYSIGDFLGK